MNNSDVAAALGEIAELLELKNESTFRIRAYENAAKALGNQTEDVRALAASGRLTKVKGVGGGIATRIEELLDTGHISYLEELRAEFPEGVRRLMSVPGVGPSLARRVYTELGVQSLDDLRAAAEDGRLASLPGLGEKSAENILRALGRVNKQESRISIGRAVPVVEELMAVLRDVAPLDNLVPGGSLRRWAPTIGDIDLMATSTDPAAAMDAFTHLPQAAQVLGHGPTKSTIITDNGLQVDLRIVEAEAYGSLVQHFTGSRDHNIELREYALQRGLSLNEYGIGDIKSGERRAFTDEVSFYRALGLDLIEPELREAHGEIAAARSHRLPQLVSVNDIRGDLHMHTEWSDGSLPIEDMIQAAADKGYEYVAITDHSGGIGVAGGLSPERILAQIEEIRRIAGQRNDIHVLAGSEVDIRRDGTLDFPDEILAQLDWVIASVHSGFNQPEDQMTQRIVRAIENPYVHAVAHPTGRLIGKREPYAVDLEAVFKAAASTHTALEINSFPERLDLVDVHARRAKDLGVMLVIDTDAHAPVHLDNIRYGVAMARRGWAEPGNVLNALPYSELRAWLRSDAP
ncbi:MAG TPA: DNA polymerase/3'-5' exonuclease PolX [Chloroflexota bacterium]